MVPETYAARLADVERLLYGDERAGELGMVKLVALLRDTVKQMAEQERQRQWLLKGIAIGMGLTTLFSGGTLLAVAQSLLAGP